jgi:hypothetical protein
VEVAQFNGEPIITQVMPSAKRLEELKSLSQDCRVIETEESEAVLLLSEAATREVCLALDNLLNQIDPHNPERQETVAFLYDDIMDVFSFGRGSYVTLNSQATSILLQALHERVPDDDTVFSNVVNTLESYTDEVTSRS